MHNKLKTSVNCTGCMACVNICPLECISVSQKKDGFFYPEIDASKCINCGKCGHVCKKEQAGNKPVKTVACYHTNRSERLEASSGGVFALLAEEIINNNGAVYGAAFEEDFSVAHRRVDKTEELKCLIGSKYVQSYIGQTYKSAKKDLDEKKMVLFSGTPCQIYALKSYLGKTYDNLITVEVICHGVPSPGVWKEYISHMKNQLGGDIRKVNFRDKSTGWQNFSLGIYGCSGEMIEPSGKNIYMKLFLGNHILRSSCYNCEYATMKRNADITLGDCWGNEEICPDMKEDGGISVAILNTQKGIFLYEKINNKLTSADVSLKTVIRYNKSFLTSPQKTSIRKHIDKLIESPVSSWKVETTYKDKVFSLLKRIYNKVFIECVLSIKSDSKK